MKFQTEMLEFFSLFHFPFLNKAHIHVLDVGCRNFSLAPIIYSLFANCDISAKVTGIEIDAFRRYRDFHTRMDYARYYEKLTPGASFLPMDFLKYNEPADVIFLLNPFVTKRPLLKWGLSLGNFQPSAIFSQCKQVLNPGGLLILSNPSEEEYGISENLLFENGFERLQECGWEPQQTSIQNDARYGALYRLLGTNIRKGA